MKIYDISQEVFGCCVYKGDTSPKKMEVRRISRGDLYNLTDILMCVHNGTHVDAPFHFVDGGRTAEAVELEKTVGKCFVCAADGDISEADAFEILRKAEAFGAEAAKRILIKGSGVVTTEAARLFAKRGVCLVGTESQSVGPCHAPVEVHRILLLCETVLLEGIRLEGVEEGEYFLCAAPLALSGSDGAPCRAILIGK